MVKSTNSKPQQGLILLIWFNFNPTMAIITNNLKPLKFENVWVIFSYTGHVITYPCWDQSKTMLV